MYRVVIFAAIGILFLFPPMAELAGVELSTERSGRRALAEFKFWQTGIVLAVIGGFWLFTGGDLEHGVGRGEIVIWAAMVLLPALILVLRLSTGLAGARAP